MLNIISKLLEAGKNKEVNFHQDGTTLWPIEKELIEFLDNYLRPGANTLETGVGMSTVIFAYKGCKHTVIAPIRGEYERVVSFCESKGYKCNNLNYFEGESQDILPKLPADELDLVLIDGGHGFPIPFVDWLYTAKRLKIGGIVIIDDIHIWTGDILMKFLSAEYQWETVKKCNKSVIFKKIGNDVVKDWGGQPFVVSNTEMPKDWPWLFNVLKGLSTRCVETAELAHNIESNDLMNVDRLSLLIEQLKKATTLLEDLKGKAKPERRES